MKNVSCESRPVRAFTLIELLIVIGIIGLLVVVTLVVGQGVVSGGKKKLTEETVRVLDAAMGAYVANKDDIPPVSFLDPRDPAGTSASQRHVVIAGDVRVMKGNTADQQMLNGVGWFLHQAESVSAVSTNIGNLSDRVRKLADVDSTDSSYGSVANAPPDADKLDQLHLTPNSFDDQPYMLTVLDGWGRPMRYVHPSLDGVLGINQPGEDLDTQQLLSGVLIGNQQFSYNRIRRSNETAVQRPAAPADFADSDGGVCAGNRPYFYSAGPDGRVGWGLDEASGARVDFNADNVYVTRPTFTKE